MFFRLFFSGCLFSNIIFILHITILLQSVQCPCAQGTLTIVCMFSMPFFICPNKNVIIYRSVNLEEEIIQDKCLRNVLPDLPA